jgi:hypothetical protein
VRSLFRYRAIFLDCLAPEDGTDSCPQASVTSCQPTPLNTRDTAQTWTSPLAYLLRCRATKRIISPLSEDGYFENTFTDFPCASPRAAVYYLMTSSAPLLTQLRKPSLPDCINHGCSKYSSSTKCPTLCSYLLT